MLRIAVLCLIATVAAAGAARAADTEKLLLQSPKGFKVAAEASNAKESTTVLVPGTENIASASTRITAQTLFKQTDQSPEAFREASQKRAAAECPGARFEQLRHGNENLYPMVMWSESCPQAKEAGKPALTWWKAVQGRENFYALQMTAAAEPDAKQRKLWTRFFEVTRVCDSRVPGQRCTTK
ncbi:hypothetical protein [Rhodopseudomonas sp. BR0G17]|uniref:hypothetical protein n=1 Tax=Rhodopseudomonas sp. BR0G17 TaxID=2269368 RepID=UPI0013E046C9|nr:hypothetical protein [Rhodopseudomonas sp. BR0G17]NEW96881.1 hypothetical protein [Rhodopseudomonas sp. BR0G17]